MVAVMSVSEWDLLGLCPLDHAWKWANRLWRFGFRTFADGFYVSMYTDHDQLLLELPTGTVIPLPPALIRLLKETTAEPLDPLPESCPSRDI